MTTTAPLIREAQNTSDLWSAAKEAGQAKEVEVWSDTGYCGMTHRADQVMAWCQAEAVLPHIDSAALREEVLHLLRRARRAAMIEAKQPGRRARVFVSIAREGDHLLAWITA